MFLDADIPFHMISWCFNPIDTTHLFLWRKIACLDREVMTSIWVRTLCFDVCLWQSLYNCPDSFLTLKSIAWRLKSDSWWPRTQRLFSENNTKTPLSEVKCLLIPLWNCLKKSFACTLNSLKQSLRSCHFHFARMTKKEFMYPIHCLLKTCFGGKVHMSHSHCRLMHGIK